MSSTADKVNALWNVQMVQRRHLEKLYPYLDWSKMPFSSYNDFFRLKNIIDDCGAVWTNAYRRSNNEAADTRKYLKDYSGNGRDIELHNFSFSKMSGYNGYTQDFLEFTNSPKISRTSTKIIVNKVDNAVSTTLSASIIPDRRFRLKFRISGLNQPIPEGNQDVLTFKIYDNGTSPVPIDYKEDGIHEVDYTLTADATLLYFFCFLSSFRSAEIQPITIEQLPLYPGALVSDGVDDYGQCIKGFALPDDFTVVAVRKILKTNGDDCLVAKSMEPDHGAFIIDYSNKGNISGGFNGHSYGYIRENPYVNEPLFSYLTKTTYNGMSITVGSRPDTDADKVAIFTKRKNTDGTYMSAALSSLGIFTRTLTEDELRIVKNCMMAEYIAMTGILDDVEYYDILDARFRSNDEDTDKRNKWTGRFGKLHMTLNNYAFSKMSGWNGSEYDFYPINDSAVVTDNRIVISKASSEVNVYSDNPPIVNHVISVKVKVSGLAKLVQKGEVNSVSLIAANSNGVVKWGNSTSKDGIVDLSVDISGVEEQVTRVFLFVNKEESSGATLVPLSSPITIEIIPDYPGALVSDGVDDYAGSDEVIDEPIGGFVFHADYTGEIASGSSAGYYFATGGSSISNNTDINAYAGKRSGNVYRGNPEISGMKTTDSIYPFSRTPAVPGKVLKIGGLSTEYLNMALYQLRLIKSQPTDIQLEAIKWQMQKEHEDYLIQNGWMEIEPDEQ